MHATTYVFECICEFAGGSQGIRAFTYGLIDAYCDVAGTGGCGYACRVEPVGEAGWC
jgi:hypothetical protein